MWPGGKIRRSQLNDDVRPVDLAIEIAFYADQRCDPASANKNAGTLAGSLEGTFD
jgi:hypothetical protein